jgi:hypothetical protein
LIQAVQKLPEQPPLPDNRPELQGQTFISLLTQLDRSLAGVQLPQVILNNPTKRKQSDSDEIARVAASKSGSISTAVGDSKSRDSTPVRVRSRSGGATLSKPEIRSATPKKTASPVET